MIFRIFMILQAIPPEGRALETSDVEKAQSE
jgi:hypothetical protein